MFDEKITQFSDLPIEGTQPSTQTKIDTEQISYAPSSVPFSQLPCLSLPSYSWAPVNPKPRRSLQTIKLSHWLWQHPLLLWPQLELPLRLLPRHTWYNDRNYLTTQRVCVSVCPTGDGSPLLCRVNSKVPSCDLAHTYPSDVNFGRLGGFCAPTDVQAQNRLMETANLNSKWNFLNIYDCIRISLLVALGLGVLWMLVVQCIPRVVALVVTVLAILSLLAMGIFVLIGNISNISNTVKIILGVILIGLAVLFSFFLCFYRRRNKLIGIFLDWSTRFMRDHIVYFFYPFIFICLTAGLVILCLFQHLAYLSKSQPQQEQGDIYLKLSYNIPLFVLNIIEFIWGLQFLKDSCNH